MAFDPTQTAKQLRERGLVTIPGAFSADQCAGFVERLEKLAVRYDAQGITDFGADLHSIMNFFRHDDALLPLVFHPIMDAVFRQVIDDDYVLIAANAINRSMKVDNPRRAADGDNWHTDSRYVGGRRLDWGFNYGMCIMLEPFTTNNAATRYVPMSHLDRTMPERMGDYAYETMTGDSGTMVIFDSGLWHRGGPPSRQSRWAIFSMYGPWFMKPYYRFQDMMQDRKASLSPDLLRLFHFDATPPRDEDEGISTLRRVREREVRRQPKYSAT
jgi:phytanoyl-CoA dioxygenase PhyH